MVFVPSENSVTCLIKTSIGLHVAVSIFNPDNNIYHMNCFLKIIKFSSQQNQIFDFDHIQQKQQRFSIDTDIYGHWEINKMYTNTYM